MRRSKVFTVLLVFVIVSSHGWRCEALMRQKFIILSTTEPKTVYRKQANKLGGEATINDELEVDKTFHPSALAILSYKH